MRSYLPSADIRVSTRALNCPISAAVSACVNAINPIVDVAYPVAKEGRCPIRIGVEGRATNAAESVPIETPLRYSVDCVASVVALRRPVFVAVAENSPRHALT